MTDDVGKRVRKNTGMMLGAKGVGALMALAGLAFAARGLSTEAFGLLVFMHAYVLFFTEVATFDSWLVVVRYGAGGRTGAEAAAENSGRFGRVVRFSATLDLAAALTAFTCAATAALALSNWIGIVAEAAPYIFAYMALILLNQKSASLGVLRLFDRYDLIALNSLTIPFVRMTGCGVAWALDAPFEAYVAAWFASSALNYLVLPVLAVRELRRRDLWRAVRDGRLSLRAPAPGVWRFAALTNVDTGLAAGVQHLPVVLAGAVGGPAYAALFRVAQEVAIVLAKGAVMIDKVVYPEFTNLIARGEGGRVPGLVARTGGAMFAIGAVIGLGFWFVGPSFLAFALAPAYAQATGLAVLLILGASLTAAVGPTFPALYAAGMPGRAILARLTGLSVMVAAFLALYHLAGEIGPGFAIVIGALTTLSAVALIAWRHDWAGQAEISAARTAETSTSAVSPSEGGPGQPGSVSARSAP